MLLLVFLVGCGGGGGGGGPVGGGGGNNTQDPPPVLGCTVNDEILAVIDAMEDLYFWNDEPVQRDKYVGIDSNNFVDTDDLLDFLRWNPAEFDRFFTHIANVIEEDQFFGPGEFVGFGFSFQLNEIGLVPELVITQVFSNSPAEAAGFARGLQITAIDGRTIADIVVAEGLQDVFGASEIDVTIEFTLQAPGNPPFTTTATKALVTIDPVPQSKIYDLGGQKIGYVEFRTFIDTAGPALLEVFSEFATAGVTNVVVDVRYNGGGLVNVAEFFASLLAGPANISKVLSFTKFNQANSLFNRTATFSAETNSIDLASIVFITTESSASATELVINALEPYLDVALVGERTFGKPVGQTAEDFCDNQRLRLVSFETVNANDVGGYFNGIAVDCPANDDLSLEIGNELEDSLATALTRITTGACPIMSVRGDAALQSTVGPRARKTINGRSVAREYSYAY